MQVRRAQAYFTVVTFVHVVLVPVVVHVTDSPIFTPSVRIVMTLSSFALASMQYPLASTFVQVIVWPGAVGCAIAKVETTHIPAMAMPNVFPIVRSMWLLLMV
jgi:hypothetical protein